MRSALGGDLRGSQAAPPQEVLHLYRGDQREDRAPQGAQGKGQRADGAQPGIAEVWDGHARPPEDFPVAEEILLPSGSAALYRRTMLEELGGFDDDFFLYCEDTDLGLRARWAGWKCLYVPQAVVEHHYSGSAGRASALKAYYVERNRLFVLAKNFPGRLLLAAPLVSFARYFWHAWYILKGQGSAARFRAEGNAGPKMIWYVLRAHAALLANLRRLWRQRRDIRARARITPAVFRHLMRSHCISAKKVAGL